MTYASFLPFILYSFFIYSILLKINEVFLAYLRYIYYLCTMFIKEYKIGDRIYKIMYRDEQAYLEQKKMFDDWVNSDEYKKQQYELWFGKNLKQ